MSSDDTPTPGEDEDRERRRRGRVTGTLVVLLLVLVVASAGALWWQQRTPPAPQGEVPLVKAEAGPTKTKPDDPGGMPVPNRDKLVYQLMSPNPPPPPTETLVPATPPVAEETKPDPAAEADPRPEPAKAPPTTAAGARELLNLPPPPETPKRALERGPDAPAEPVKPVVTARLDPPPGAREATPPDTSEPKPAEEATPAADAKPADEPKPTEETKPDAPAAAASTAAEKPTGTKPGEAEKPAEPVQQAEPPPAKPATAEKPAAEDKPAEPPAQKADADPAPAKQMAAATDVFRVQIAAFREEGIAMKEWRRLQGIHADALAGLEPYVETVDLGRKGLFHRLQAGPLASREAALATCARLKAAKQDCLVVAPN